MFNIAISYNYKIKNLIFIFIFFFNFIKSAENIGSNTQQTKFSKWVQEKYKNNINSTTIKNDLKVLLEKKISEFNNFKYKFLAYCFITYLFFYIKKEKKEYKFFNFFRKNHKIVKYSLIPVLFYIFYDCLYINLYERIFYKQDYEDFINKVKDENKKIQDIIEAAAKNTSNPKSINTENNLIL